jgi:small subunit ribosomal protein S20
MANHPSAEKRNRQRIKRTLRNKVARGASRTAVKRAREALAAEDTKEAAERVQAAVVALAKAAKKGAIHPRKASRTTARISRALGKLS